MIGDWVAASSVIDWCWDSSRSYQRLEVGRERWSFEIRSEINGHRGMAWLRMR